MHARINNPALSGTTPNQTSSADRQIRAQPGGVTAAALVRCEASTVQKGPRLHRSRARTRRVP